MGRNRVEPPLVAIAFILALSIFYLPILLQNFFLWEDALVAWYPLRSLLATSIRSGKFILWNPYVFSGLPFVGDVQNTAFYPFSVILLLFIRNGKLSYLAFELIVFLHNLIAGLFTYLYLRDLKLKKISAFLGGLSFILGGFLAIRVIQLPVHNSFSWLPFIVFFLHRALISKNLRYTILAAFGLALSFLAGHPQFTLYIIYFIGFYAVFFALKERKLYPVVSAIIIILLGVGLASLQLLPSFVYHKYTLREKLTYDAATIHSVHPLRIITLLIPKFFGSTTGYGTDTVPVWFPREYATFWETCLYVGILPLLFAFCRPSRGKKLYYFFVFIALFALFGTFGKYTPIYKLMYYILPGFNKFRCPGRLSSIFTFAVSVLGAIGFDELFIKRKNNRFLRKLLIFLAIYFIFGLVIYSGGLRKFVPGSREYSNIINQFTISLVFIILIVLLCYLNYKIRKNIIPYIAVFLVFIELYIFGHNFPKGNINPYEFFAETPLVKYLQSEYKTEKFRINARIGPYMILRRNSGVIYGLELIEGYTPLGLYSYTKFRQHVPREKQLDLLNVKYRVKIDTIRGRLYLGKNDDYLPRTFLAYNYTVADDDSALKLLASKDFDYRNIIIINKSPRIKSKPKPINPDRVRIIKYSPNEVKLKVDTPDSAIVVLLDIYFPHWQAFIDGKSTEIYKIDYLFRGVITPPGHHIITWKYISKPLNIGILLSVIALGICILIFVKPKILERIFLLGKIQE